MATTLINMPSISNTSVHQNGLLDARRIHNIFNQNFEKLFITYNDQKLSGLNTNNLTLSPNDLVESLSIHMYDTSNHRSFSNTKLIDFIESNLKNANDYLKNIKTFIEIPQIKNYLKNNIILAPMDFPGQYNLRKLIVNKISTNNERIPDEIVNVIPILGPLHVSLNSRETCVKKYYPFFNGLYKFVLNKKKSLSKNPPPFRINYLLYLAHSGWLTIRKDILDIFQSSKSIGIRTLIDLLDNVVPAVLDIYTTLF